MQGCHIGRTLDAENQDGEIPCVLIHLSPSAFALHLHFAEVRDENTKKQAKTVVKDDGSLDYESLGKIMSDKETAAAQAKEQEIAKNQDVPGGGSAGGENKNKTADVENAEKITFGNPASNSDAKNSYVI